MAPFLLLLGTTGSPRPEKETMKLRKKDPEENKESQKEQRKVVSPVFLFPLTCAFPVARTWQSFLIINAPCPGEAGWGDNSTEQVTKRTDSSEGCCD